MSISCFCERETLSSFEILEHSASCKRRHVTGVSSESFPGLTQSLKPLETAQEQQDQVLLRSARDSYLGKQQKHQST